MGRESYWSRRLGRRRLLAGAAATGAGVAGLALVGCDGDDDDDSESASPTPGATSGVRPGTATAPTPTTPGETPVAGGVLKSRQTAPFASINPYNGLDSGLLWGFTIFDHLFYTPLDTGVRENFLATGIEQPDPLTINIAIGEAYFHDKPPISGRKVTAKDIKASYDAARVQTKISNSSWWSQVLDTVTVTDETHLTVKLKSIDAWTFSSTNFGSPIASSILPEEIAKDPAQMDTKLIGSGRYQFVSHENGTNFRIERFPKWRIKGEPLLGGIQYKLIQEQALALAAFSAQEIDSVTPNNKLERDELVQKHGKSIEVDQDVSRSVWTLLPRGDGQWADPRVIKAISMALDRKEFIELMNFGDGLKTGPVPPPFTAQALTEKEIEETWGRSDPGEAKKLLAATAFDTEKKYELKFIASGQRNAQFAQIVKSQLEKNLGIKISLIGEDLGTWLLQSLYGSLYDGFLTYASLAYDDPSSYIGGYSKKIGGRDNWAGFANDELDQVVADQKAILDNAKRDKAVHDLQLRAWELGAPFIPVFVSIASTCTWGYVKGRVVGRGSYGLFSGRTYIDKS